MVAQVVCSQPRSAEREWGPYLRARGRCLCAQGHAANMYYPQLELLSGGVSLFPTLPPVMENRPRDTPQFGLPTPGE